MASAHAHDHSAHLKVYGGVFAFLSVLTAIEMLPLWGLLALPAPVLLGMSAVKFVVVCLFFMHLYGDKAVNSRLFFIPLVIAGFSVIVLMQLFGGMHLQYQESEHGRDSDLVAARYSERWDTSCYAWATSPFTHNSYCASPVVAWNTQPAYDVFSKPSAADPEFAEFDKMAADAKRVLLLKKGEAVYSANCIACHQKEGTGLADTFPPLAGDPVANGGSVETHIHTVLKGINGVAINGKAYTGAMSPWAQLSDDEIASVITYERNSWGNNGGVVEPAQVAKAR